MKKKVRTFFKNISTFVSHYRQTLILIPGKAFATKFQNTRKKENRFLINVVRIVMNVVPKERHKHVFRVATLIWMCVRSSVSV